MNTTFALCDLPNQEGFKFIGVDGDWNEHECIVYKDAIGCHSIKRIDTGEPFFMRLLGWRKLTPNVESRGASPEGAASRLDAGLAGSDE